MVFVPFLPKLLPDYLTAPHLAGLLGVSKNTVHNWSRSGVLPEPVRLSKRCYLFDSRAVRAALLRFFPEVGNESIATPVTSDAQQGALDRVGYYIRHEGMEKRVELFPTGMPVDWQPPPKDPPARVETE